MLPSVVCVKPPCSSANPNRDGELPLLTKLVVPEALLVAPACLSSRFSSASESNCDLMESDTVKQRKDGQLSIARMAADRSAEFARPSRMSGISPLSTTWQSSVADDTVLCAGAEIARLDKILKPMRARRLNVMDCSHESDSSSFSVEEDAPCLWREGRFRPE